MILFMIFSINVVCFLFFKFCGVLHVRLPKACWCGNSNRHNPTVNHQLITQKQSAKYIWPVYIADVSPCFRWGVRSSCLKKLKGKNTESIHFSPCGSGISFHPGVEHWTTGPKAVFWPIGSDHEMYSKIGIHNAYEFSSLATYHLVTSTYALSKVTSNVAPEE